MVLLAQNEKFYGVESVLKNIKRILNETVSNNISALGV